MKKSTSSAKWAKAVANATGEDRPAKRKPKKAKLGKRSIVMTSEHLNRMWQRGVIAAASVAATYNGSTTHEYRLDDCILAKLNLSKVKPRKNKSRIQAGASAFIAGMGLALAEMYRLESDGADECKVARDAGLSLADFRKAGVDSYDLKALRRAGIR